jgi:hypothetical protein
MSAQTLGTLVGALGGVIVFFGALYAVIKSAFAQVTATKDNTKALEKLTSTVNGQDGRLDNHEIRLTRLEAKSGE